MKRVLHNGRGRIRWGSRDEHMLRMQLGASVEEEVLFIGRFVVPVDLDLCPPGRLAVERRGCARQILGTGDEWSDGTAGRGGSFGGGGGRLGTWRNHFP